MGHGHSKNNSAIPDNSLCDGVKNGTGDWLDCNGVADIVPGVGEANRATQIGRGIASGDVGQIAEGSTMLVINTLFDACSLFTFGLCKGPQLALKAITAPIKRLAAKGVAVTVEKQVVKTIENKGVKEIAKKLANTTKGAAKFQGAMAGIGAIKEGVDTNWQYDRMRKAEIQRREEVYQQNVTKYGEVLYNEVYEERFLKATSDIVANVKLENYYQDNVLLTHGADFEALSKT